jgi:CheY-like chemotaxis protein
MPNGNVLVVEDDDTIRRLLIEYLKSHDLVNVDGARDGVEALHLIVTNLYAVVVLDVMMPKMSGIDVLDSLEALLFDPSVKSLHDPPAVLIITSAEKTILPDVAIAQRCPGSVQRVFRKPFDIAELAGCVGRYLGAG